MTRETQVLVVGAGLHGIAAARAAKDAGADVLVLEKGPKPEADLPAGVDVLVNRMALDVILSPEGAVAGAVVADPDAYDVVPIRAGAVILATGGVSSLWTNAAKPLDTGDGLAIAHRAGAFLEGLTPTFTGPKPGLRGGVVTREDGAVPGVRGLHAAGEPGAHGVPGATVGAAAAGRLPDAPRELGAYAVMPNVDSPLPRGFVDVKLDRLRAVMNTHLGRDGTHDLERARTLLHQLKGEGDEFARARVDVDLLSFKNACEVAVLIARMGGA